MPPCFLHTKPVSDSVEHSRSRHCFPLNHLHLCWLWLVMFSIYCLEIMCSCFLPSHRGKTLRDEKWKPIPMIKQCRLRKVSLDGFVWFLTAWLHVRITGTNLCSYATHICNQLPDSLGSHRRSDMDTLILLLMTSYLLYWKLGQQCVCRYGQANLPFFSISHHLSDLWRLFLHLCCKPIYGIGPV